MFEFNFFVRPDKFILSGSFLLRDAQDAARIEPLLAAWHLIHYCISSQATTKDGSGSTMSRVPLLFYTSELCRFKKPTLFAIIN